MESKLEERPMRTLEEVNWERKAGRIEEPLIKAEAKVKRAPFKTPKMKFLRYQAIGRKGKPRSLPCQQLFFLKTRVKPR